MEALRQDDPRRFGPYTVLARLRETASAVQYLAHVAASQDAVVITAARPELAALPAFRRRFQAEADTADRLTGDWTPPQPAGADDTPDDAADDTPNTAADESPDEDLLWTAGPYVPALTLAEAIGTTGPLPERAVRILGAGIAETLSRVHATGAVLQGLAPRTVLLAGDGPRLTAFGPLGAAAAAEARPGGQLSVRLGYLTPEQVAGEEPGPASDLFVLGLLLAYAATGTTPLADGPAAEGAERIARTAPELGAVPEELRDLVARCLAKSPPTGRAPERWRPSWPWRARRAWRRAAGCPRRWRPRWRSRGPGHGRRSHPAARSTDRYPHPPRDLPRVLPIPRWAPRWMPRPRDRSTPRRASRPTPRRAHRPMLPPLPPPDHSRPQPLSLSPSRTRRPPSSGTSGARPPGPTARRPSCPSRPS